MKTTRRLLIAVSLAASLSATGACGGTMKPDEAIAQLNSADATDRRNAADALRGGRMRSLKSSVVPAEGVQPLLAALAKETDAKTRAAMLISLGASGAPEAKAPIDEWVKKASDHQEQKWYGKDSLSYQIK
jgi:HEAT repeats